MSLKKVVLTAALGAAVGIAIDEARKSAPAKRLWARGRALLGFSPAAAPIAPTTSGEAYCDEEGGFCTKCVDKYQKPSEPKPPWQTPD